MKHTFDGSDPIEIVDFLTPFVGEADIINMSEAQDFIALPNFLADFAKTKFRTYFKGWSRCGGITSWPEAFQYLFRTIATASMMYDALESIHNI